MSEQATALAMEHIGPTVRATVHEGWDVYGTPHGGYLAALAGRAVTDASGQPDLFAITTHYLARAAVGPIEFEIAEVAASRRFRTVRARGIQGDTTVLAVLASVGDRSSIEGASWSGSAAWSPRNDELGPPAGDPRLGFDPPEVAKRFGLRVAHETSGFARGEQGADARMRAVLSVDEPDQYTALIACDITPPALWNVLPPAGWVPTIELTAHVRNRPAPGPLSVEVSTSHVTDGFLEEDAVVRDVQGVLIVQSRQLARWTGE